ncbi:tripartite tricarboxylate transporter TctB family protein [Pseudothermotoga sp.]
MIADVVVSIFLLIFSLVLLNQARQYNYLSAVFPQFVLVFLMILTVILSVRAIVLFKKRRTSESKFVATKDLFYVFLVAALSFLWVYVMDWVLGFLLGSIVFGIVIFAILAGRSLKVKHFVLYSLGYCAIVFIFWYALGRLLHVPLPRGLFF